jgi:SWI/SNF-related matrix-associated actin-dependent regulator of chromatin subfamily A-like protein 1
MGGMKLYPYQEVGRDFLASRDDAYLGDVMRLGKSVQATAAARLVQPERTVIVCPASAVPNWQAEWEKWDGPGEPEIYSYNALLRRKVRPADLVILDEAHYCKSPSAKRTRTALSLARDSGRAWLLSGTPLPNDPTELWPAVRYLWPEIAQELNIRTKEEWMFTFCKVRLTPYGPRPYAVQNAPILRDVVNRIMLRRTLDDVGLELPPLRVDLHRLPKGDLDLSEYEAMEASEETYTSSLRRVLGVAKAPAVARQIIEELNDGAYGKIVVLYYHREVGRVLRESFDAVNPYWTTGFDGRTSQPDRWQAIQNFQTGRHPIFLAQQVAAGIAIDLSAADEIVLVEPAWTPDENSQAVARIRNIHKSRPCRARIFAISGTMDTAVMSTIRAKVRMRREVLA